MGIIVDKMLLSNPRVLVDLYEENVAALAQQLGVSTDDVQAEVSADDVQTESQQEILVETTQETSECWSLVVGIALYGQEPGLILGLRPANERRRYFVTTSLIRWAQA